MLGVEQQEIHIGKSGSLSAYKIVPEVYQSLPNLTFDLGEF